MKLEQLQQQWESDKLMEISSTKLTSYWTIPFRTELENIMSYLKPSKSEFQGMKKASFSSPI